MAPANTSQHNGAHNRLPYGKARKIGLERVCVVQDSTRVALHLDLTKHSGEQNDADRLTSLTPSCASASSSATMAVCAARACKAQAERRT